MSADFINWITVISFVLAIASIGIGIYQIYLVGRVKKVAEAAKESADRTQTLITKNLLLSEVSTSTRTLEEVKFLVRSERYEAALLRVSDLTSQLIQIQQMLSGSNQSLEIDFEQILSVMLGIRDNFEKKGFDSAFEIQGAIINSQLAVVSDELNKWIGKVKIVVEKEDENGKGQIEANS
jgi:hypothetical protein